MSSRPTLAECVSAIVADQPPRAAGFIVTLYGDAVVPRGGEVWIGTIIDTCAGVGISETLVRTAVSRLVAAGQLEGWRRGRRSFYRLSDRAGAEFEAASRLIYGPPEPWRWRFLHLPETGAEALMATLERQGYARLRPTLAVGPARGALPKGVLAFDAVPEATGPLLADFAAQAWDLAPHAAAYRALIAAFAPCETAAPETGNGTGNGSGSGSGAEALAARLLLVHRWRHALLRDPRLPPEALPADWPGHAARALFHRLYTALTPAADSHIAARFEGAQGLLAQPVPARTPAACPGGAGENSETGQGLRGEVLRAG